MTEVVIASAVRTPIGKYGKALRDVPAPRLGAHVARLAIERAGLKPSEIDEVLMGTAIAAGQGQAPARQVALLAGVPADVGAVTINKVCASGMKAITFAFDEIRSGSISVAVAGAMESMSQAPYLIKNTRWGSRPGHQELLDGMTYDGLQDALAGFHMGATGDWVARKYAITREDQDAFALESHMRALKAYEAGRLREEVVPLEVERDGARVMFDRDEGVRPDTSLEKLARLKPAFLPDGTVTAGNASQLSDGASAVIVMNEEAAEERGVTPLARIVDYAVGGVKPEDVMEAPIPTVRKLLAKTGLSIDDFDLLEHNEAYASASLAVSKALGIPREKLNVHGGAVALGHPIGCSGARIVTTLLHAMRARHADRGLATLCLGGGNGMAIVVERQ